MKLQHDCIDRVPTASGNQGKRGKQGNLKCQGNVRELYFGLQKYQDIWFCGWHDVDKWRDVKASSHVNVCCFMVCMFPATSIPQGKSYVHSFSYVYLLGRVYHLIHILWSILHLNMIVMFIYSTCIILFLQGRFWRDKWTIIWAHTMGYELHIEALIQSCWF